MNSVNMVPLFMTLRGNIPFRIDSVCISIISLERFEIFWFNFDALIEVNFNLILML